MAPQPMTIDRALILARAKARTAKVWEPTWEHPAEMERHLRFLEERGTVHDVRLALGARARLISRFPHLFGGWAPQPEPVLTFTEAAFFFALGVGLSAGVGFILSIII